MIAYVMIYAAAVGLPIYLAAAVGSAFLRRHGRAERGVWLLALVITLAFPVMMLSRPPVAVPTPWTPVLESVAIDLAPVVIVPAVADAPPVVGVQDVLLALWLLASLVLVARWAVSSIRLARLRRSWRTESLGGVRVSLSLDTGPGVFGIVRPRIVVPSWVATLPDPQRSLVLRHEQEHLHGGDHWLAALGRVARILIPWHPFVWLVTSRLARAMELDCDRRVLRRHPDVAAYGTTLLLVSARGSNALLADAAFAESDVSLRRRILAMTTPPRTLSAVGLVSAITIGVVLLTGALEVPVPASGLPIVRLPEALRVTAPATEEVAAGALPAATGAAPEVSPTSQQTLPEPRVIANPYGRRLIASIFRQDSILLAGRDVPLEPGLEIILSSDSVPVTYVGQLRLGPEIATPEMARAALAGQFGDSLRWGIGWWPAGSFDPAPETTVAPRILNPGEVIAAIARYYPLDLSTQSLGGTVGMQFLIGQTGAVQETRIGQHSAYPDLDRAAERVAQTYLFSPAFLGDQAFAVWVSHTVDFTAP